MNIEEMVHELIKAQEAIGEPISIIRKTEVEDEIHNSCSGSGVDLLILQMAGISELFEKLASDMPNSAAMALKRATLSTIEESFDKTIGNKPTIH